MAGTEGPGRISPQELVQLRRDAVDRAISLQGLNMASSEELSTAEDMVTDARKIAEFLQNG